MLGMFDQTAACINEADKQKDIKKLPDFTPRSIGFIADGVDLNTKYVVMEQPSVSMRARDS
jgi:hypothetical protein